MSTPPVPSEVESPLPPPEPNPVLWERRRELGFLNALYGTTRDVLLHPKDFFSRIPVTGGLVDPLFFCIVLSTVCGLLDRADTLLFEPEKLASFSRTFIVVSTILSPLIALVCSFLASGITHLCLTLSGGRNRGFEATFRVYCYCASIGVFFLIPFYGTFVGFVAFIFYQCIGLKLAHDTTTGKAVFAFVVSMIVFVVILFVFAVTVFPTLGITPKPHTSN